MISSELFNKFHGENLNPYTLIFDTHCIKLYLLAQKISLDQDSAWDRVVDCFLTLLFYRHAFSNRTHAIGFLYHLTLHGLPLPPRCKQVFRLVLAGKNTAEIAVQLNISKKTVLAHKRDAIQTLTNIYF